MLGRQRHSEQASRKTEPIFMSNPLTLGITPTNSHKTLSSIGLRASTASALVDIIYLRRFPADKFISFISSFCTYLTFFPCVYGLPGDFSPGFPFVSHLVANDEGGKQRMTRIIYEIIWSCQVPKREEVE